MSQSLHVWFLSTAIKVSCVGSCGVSNKINDTAWTVEEQYFNSTLSLADKGKVHSDVMEICDSEMLNRNELLRFQHLCVCSTPSQAALNCAQRMGANIRDENSLEGAVREALSSCRTWQPPRKHCLRALAPALPEMELPAVTSPLFQGLVGSLCSAFYVCWLWWSQNTDQSWSAEPTCRPGVVCTEREVELLLIIQETWQE